jgi:hypothetical protein
VAEEAMTGAAQRPAWIREVFDRFFGHAEDADRLLHLSIQGIRNLRGFYGVTEALIRFRDIVPAAAARERSEAEREDVDKRRLAEAQKTSDLAKSEVKDGFPLLHANTLVGLWGALDTLVDDLVVAVLLNDPTAIRGKALSKVRVPLARFEQLEPPERMRLLITHLKE